MTQLQLGAAAGVEPRAISRLEVRGDGDVRFDAVVRLVEVLELDLELRPRGSDFTPRPPTKLNELGLSAGTMSTLTLAEIENVGELSSAKAMLARPHFSDGTELHEIVCALSRYGLSLHHGHVPGAREREIFRLRVVEGLTLKELGMEFGVQTERI